MPVLNAQHLQSLIHLDQVGFIPTRDARDNTIKVLVHIANTKKILCVFISTDAEKAFNRLNWNYMFSVLRHIWVGERMISWIHRIYSNPMAQVKVNGLLSEPFLIENRTRQGCPLLPLLFALSLEPFLCTVSLNTDIQGLHARDSQGKVSAYVDDLLFSLTNPTISLPNLMKEFDIYGNLSNLKINFSKSGAMGIAIASQSIQTIQSNFHFKWTKSALNYLGTYIPPDLPCTFALNVPPLMNKTRSLLELIKMCILPKFLYLFQALPIQIPTPFLK